jgi:transposase-like protein
MPEFQPVSSASTAAIERPGCPKCKQSRMLLARLEKGSSGVGYRTFECQSCGCVRTMVVSTSDPMNSRTQGWFAGELRRPT